jgi:hypothetical protein
MDCAFEDRVCLTRGGAPLRDFGKGIEDRSQAIRQQFGYGAVRRAVEDEYARLRHDRPQGYPFLQPRDEKRVATIGRQVPRHRLHAQPVRIGLDHRGDRGSTGHALKDPEIGRQRAQSHRQARRFEIAHLRERMEWSAAGVKVCFIRIPE